MENIILLHATLPDNLEPEPKIEDNPMKLDNRRIYAGRYKKRPTRRNTLRRCPHNEDTKRGLENFRVPTHLSHAKSADVLGTVGLDQSQLVR